MSQRKRILIIEADPELAAFMQRALDGSTYGVDAVPDGTQGLAYLATNTPDLVLLDLDLPDFDGFALCQRILQSFGGPIVVFTPANSTGDPADALDLGAHDFLASPWNVRELRTRVRRALTRAVMSSVPQPSLCRVGALEIDLHSQTLTRHGQLVPLSRTDWALLEFMVRHAGQILPYRMLLQHVWGSAYTQELGYLRSYVKRLRDALEEDPKHPRYLQTEARLGYRFALPEQPQQPVTQIAPAKALPSGDGAPASKLPMHLTSFVGRDGEIGDIKAMLRRPDVRLLTLTGPGGVGKTRLGLRVGQQLADEDRLAVRFVDLSRLRSPDTIVPAIAEVVQIKGFGDDGGLERVSHALQATSHLLLLDNFEHLVAGAPLVGELLRSVPELKIVATSRSPLHVSGEHEYPVLPLALPDHTAMMRLDELARLPVVALFVARARAVKPDFVLTAENASVIADICVGLDGLPLAIELAAARIKVLSVQQIAALLTRRLALLTSGPRDLPARQQTLRSLLDWSCNLIGPDYKLLFERLAVFVDGGTLAAIGAVCRPGADTTLDLLDGLSALVDASLLQPDEGEAGDVRFRMLATIREYAGELLEQSGAYADVRDRHMRYFLSLAETAADALKRMHNRQWLDRLERDHDNLRAALQWAADRQDAEVLARFIASLWQFWHVHGHRQEAYRWVEAALAHQNSLPVGVRAKALYGAGWLAYDGRRYDQALAFFDESLAALRTLNDRLGVSEVLRGLGEVALSQGAFARAQRLFEESCQLSDELGNSLGRAWSLLHLGRVALEQGRLSQAATMLNECCSLFAGVGEKEGTAWSLHNLGRVALERRVFEQADQLLSDSLVLFSELGDKSGRAWTLQNLGRSALEQGAPEQALRLLHESLVLFRDVGDQHGSGWSLLGLGRATAVQGDRMAARDLFDESLLCFRKVSDDAGIQQAMREADHAATP